MYALTLTAPWGTLISIAAQYPTLGKHWETRGWQPRGLSKPLRFAIHQGKNLGPVGGRAGLAKLHDDVDPIRRALFGVPFPLPLGRIVAVATLADVGTACWGYAGAQQVPAVRWPDGRIENVPEPELSFGDYTPGRRVWRLTDIVALPEPVEASGSRSLWMLGPRAAAAVAAQIGEAL